MVQVKKEGWKRSKEALMETFMDGSKKWTNICNIALADSITGTYIGTRSTIEEQTSRWGRKSLQTGSIERHFAEILDIRSCGIDW